MPVQISIEPIGPIKDKLERLAWAEYEEVGEVKPFRPDWESLEASEKAGILQAVVARDDGEVVGYLGVMIDFDVESKGTLIAHQQAWYCLPSYLGVGTRMLDFAIQHCADLGVKWMYLHHGTQGRGAKAGILFERRGGKLISYTYRLEL